MDLPGAISFIETVEGQPLSVGDQQGVRLGQGTDFG